MIVSNLLVFMTFGITENFIHLVGKDFTLSIMLKVVENTLIMSLIAASIGIVAVGIGFIKKSIPTTIVSAVLIASLMCNIVINASLSRVTMYVLTTVMIFVGIVFSIFLIKKVNVMEVE